MRNKSKLQVLQILLFVIIYFTGIIVLLTVSSMAINDHDKISSWNNCKCFFDSNSTYDIIYDYYSSVELNGTAECKDNKIIYVTIKWPPAKKW